MRTRTTEAMPDPSSSSLSLPDDIILHILSRLPGKTLLQFRVASQIWHNLISSLLHNTINYTLLDHNTHLPPPCSVCHLGTPDHQLLQEFTRNFFTTTTTTTTNSGGAGEKCHHLRLWRVMFRGGTFTFAGCVDGLICFYQHCCHSGDLHIYVWNPCLNEFRALPKSNIYSCKGLAYYSTMVCLLYNAVHGDYQVVKILYLLCSGWYKADIYSLTTNSWKPLVSEFHPHNVQHLCYSRWKTIIYNGFPHWLAICNHEPAMCLLNLNEKIIRQVPLPEGVYHEPGQLELLDGCLSIFSGFTRSKLDVFEVWMMKEEYGCWTKKIVIQDMQVLHQRTTGLAGKLNHHLFAIRKHPKSRKCLVLYDLEKETVVEEEVALLQKDLDLVWPNYYYTIFDYVPSSISQ